jgi:formiminotetrahydrofolate cyclodeaminase
MIVDGSVRRMLDALGSPDPTPGGGSASALASAAGASLLVMVARLPKTRSGADEDRAALASAGEALAKLRETLIDAIDADTAAYDRVVAAYKLPKTSADEQSARKDAIQRALVVATEVPLSVVRASADALVQAAAVAAHGNASAASDVGVAVALLRAGAHGARLNVEINVGGLADAAFAERVRQDVVRAAESAARDADKAVALLR